MHSLFVRGTSEGGGGEWCAHHACHVNIPKRVNYIMKYLDSQICNMFYSNIFKSYKSYKQFALYIYKGGGVLVM